VFDGGLHLGGERQRVGDAWDVQFPGVEGLFELRGHGVEAAGDGGDEQEGPGEDPGIEVDPEQEGLEPAAVRGLGAGRPGGPWGFLLGGRRIGQENHGLVFQNFRQAAQGAPGRSTAVRGTAHPG
jgi:hypothetical protein